MQQKVLLSEATLKGVIQDLFSLENNLHQLTRTMINDKKLIQKLFDSQTLIRQCVGKNLICDNQSIDTNPGKTVNSKLNEIEEQNKNSKCSQQMQQFKKYIDLENLKNIEEAKQFNEKSFDQNLVHNNVQKKKVQNFLKEKKQKKKKNYQIEQKEQKEEKEEKQQKKKKKSKKDENNKKCQENQRNNNLQENKFTKVNQNNSDFEIDKRKVIVLEDYETEESKKVSPTDKQFETKTTNYQNDQQQYSQSIVIDLDDFTISNNLQNEISENLIEIDKKEQKKKTQKLGLDDPTNTKCKFCEKVMRIKSMKVHLEKIHQGQGLEDWKNRKSY